MALAMASTRIRGGGAEATSGLTVALYAGPALTVVAFAFTFFRRRKLAPDSEDARVATIVMRAWLAAAVMDVIFLVVNLVRLSRG
jgi:hypothetical protein